MAQQVSTEATIPPYHEMMWPTLQVLVAMGGSGTIQEITDGVIQVAGYSDAQQSVIHQGKGPQTEIAYRLAWARTYLKAAGAITNSSRGVWAITDYGRTVTKSDVPAVRIRARERMTTKEDNSPPQESVIVDVEFPVVDHAVERMVVFRSTDFEQWRERLLEVLVAIDAKQFERLCQRLLRESGFTKVEVTGRTGDGGIDGTGVLRIALLSFQVLFQCKRYSGNVGSEEIRNFRGAMVGRTDKGLFITTGSFTPSAKREATRDGAPVIDLIDGDQLCILLKDLKLGVDTQQVEEVLINPEWYSTI